MLWKILCCTLQSMGCTNHKFPTYATRNAQTHLKSTVQFNEGPLFFLPLPRGPGDEASTVEPPILLRPAEIQRKGLGSRVHRSLLAILYTALGPTQHCTHPVLIQQWTQFISPL